LLAAPQRIDDYGPFFECRSHAGSLGNISHFGNARTVAEEVISNQRSCWSPHLNHQTSASLTCPDANLLDTDYSLLFNAYPPLCLPAIGPSHNFAPSL
jgi:hypothetical protein